MKTKTLKDYMPASVRQYLADHKLPTTHANCRLASAGVGGYGKEGVFRPGKTARDRAKRNQ